MAAVVVSFPRIEFRRRGKQEREKERDIVELGLLPGGVLVKITGAAAGTLCPAVTPGNGWGWPWGQGHGRRLFEPSAAGGRGWTAASQGSAAATGCRRAMGRAWQRGSWGGADVAPKIPSSQSAPCEGVQGADRGRGANRACFPGYPCKTTFCGLPADPGRQLGGI